MKIKNGVLSVIWVIDSTTTTTTTTTKKKEKKKGKD